MQQQEQKIRCLFVKMLFQGLFPLLSQLSIAGLRIGEPAMDQRPTSVHPGSIISSSFGMSSIHIAHGNNAKMECNLEEAGSTSTRDEPCNRVKRV